MNIVDTPYMKCYAMRMVEATVVAETGACVCVWQPPLSVGAIQCGRYTALRESIGMLTVFVVFWTLVNFS